MNDTLDKALEIAKKLRKSTKKGTTQAMQNLITELNLTLADLKVEVVEQQAGLQQTQQPQTQTTQQTTQTRPTQQRQQTQQQPQQKVTKTQAQTPQTQQTTKSSQDQQPNASSIAQALAQLDPKPSKDDDDLDFTY